jgi:hypothetical protein
MIRYISQKFEQVDARLKSGLLRFADNVGYSRWRNFPLGRGPRGEKIDYEKRYRMARDAQNQAVDDIEKALGHSIQKEFIDSLAYNIQISYKTSFPDYSHGRVLYAVLSSYLDDYDITRDGPITVFETGTARGFSLLCMAKALRDRRIPGKIITFDVIPHESVMYWNCIIDHLKGPTTRKELLNPWTSIVDEYGVFVEGDTRLMLKKIHPSRIHFAFLDGGHTYEDVCSEFECINQKQKFGDIVIFDDYNDIDFPGIVNAVDNISLKFGYSKTIIPLTGKRSLAICKKIAA